jgi:hypothetical protein
MLNRLYLLLSGIWALCCIVPETMSDYGHVDAKVLGIAFAPFALGWALMLAARFVITGSVMKPRIRATRPPR